MVATTKLLCPHCHRYSRRRAASRTARAAPRRLTRKPIRGPAAGEMVTGLQRPPTREALVQPGRRSTGRRMARAGPPPWKCCRVRSKRCCVVNLRHAPGQNALLRQHVSLARRCREPTAALVVSQSQLSVSMVMPVQMRMGMQRRAGGCSRCPSCGGRRSSSVRPPLRTRPRCCTPSKPRRVLPACCAPGCKSRCQSAIPAFREDTTPLCRLKGFQAWFQLNCSRPPCWSSTMSRCTALQVAGVPEDELQREDQQGAAQGRFAFGTGADFGQPSAAAAAADHRYGVAAPHPTACCTIVTWHLRSCCAQ